MDAGVQHSLSSSVFTIIEIQKQGKYAIFKHRFIIASSQYRP